ncbi:MAG: radical SAM protein [Candidatus Helarchaeota archaeon]|nr:radical SAM protein [Candidatus Helarchaeota archaeon]
MPKLKTCTYNCAYCELGKTSLKGYVSTKYRCNVPPHFKEDLSAELREKLVECSSYVNAITFGYNGEPTLNEDLGLILDLTRKLRYETGIEKVPISIFTNSSTLGVPEVRKSLLNFDIVIAKLDAGTQEIFSSTNNPHHSVPSLKEIIKNIKLLKSEMKQGNNLYIQTLLYKVRAPTSLKSNGTRENVKAIAEAINEIRPDRIQMYSIARPPAEPKVIALTKMELIQLSDLMAELVEEPTEVFHFH